MKETVLVTGASSGTGAAAARFLHEHEFRVFGTTRALDPVPTSDFQMLSLDVTSDNPVRECVQKVLSQAGRLDILVSNAGYALTGAAEETSVDEAKTQFETNFFGVVRMVDRGPADDAPGRCGQDHQPGIARRVDGYPFHRVLLRHQVCA